ncbi:MAG: hypothetical protein ACK4RZ_16710 [Paracoccaceae bacterium]
MRPTTRLIWMSPISRPLPDRRRRNGASLSAAVAALIHGPSPAGRVLTGIAAIAALVSFGPQKYLDPQFGLIWSAVLSGQVAAGTILLGLMSRFPTIAKGKTLPQFVPPTDPSPMLTMGLMGLVLMAQTFVVFLAYGAVAARAGDLLRRRRRIMVLFQTGIAVLFAGLGPRGCRAP